MTLSASEIIKKCKKGDLGSYKAVSLTPVPEEIMEQVPVDVMLCPGSERIRKSQEQPAPVCKGQVVLG